MQGIEREDQMIRTIKKLPKRIRLSQYLEEKASCYVEIVYSGHSFYIPATKTIRAMLGINKNGKRIEGEPQPQTRKGWKRDFDNDVALRDIVDALYLQIRDYVLSEVEGNVSQMILEKMEKAMENPIHRLTERVAAELEDKNMLTEKRKA
jgi:hypothetical protein